MEPNPAQVEHRIELAQLAFLIDAEKRLSREQLSRISEFAEQLPQVASDDIPLTATVLAPEHVMRDIALQVSLLLDGVLVNETTNERWLLGAGAARERRQATDWYTRKPRLGTFQPEAIAPDARNRLNLWWRSP